MELVRTLVGRQLVRFAIDLDLGVFDPIRHPPNRLSEERRVGIGLGVRISEDDVVTCNLELLNDGALGEERKAGI